MGQTAVGAVEEAVVVEGAAVSQNRFHDPLSFGDLMDRQDASAMAEMLVMLNASNASLQHTIKVLTTLVSSLQQREHNLRQFIVEQLQVLQSAVGSADYKVNRVVENALPRLTQLTNQALSQTLEPAAKQFNKEMAAADETLQQATRRYAQAQQSLRRGSHVAWASHRPRCSWQASWAWVRWLTRLASSRKSEPNSHSFAHPSITWIACRVPT